MSHGMKPIKSLPMNNKLIIRSITTNDEHILWQMLYYAAHMDEDEGKTVEDAKVDPFLRRYVAEWGQKDDLGFIAEINRHSVGAVWVRFFEEEEYPELAIAVLPDWAGRGIGTRLMKHIITQSKEQFSGIMLSVRADNPAYNLYRLFGFKTSREIINRVGTISYEMHLDF
jgi:ribosomal protein S18 acetylase RimI-like enzyme